MGRGNGRTTWLVEKAVWYAGEGEVVLVGVHSHLHDNIKHRLKAAGLIGVEVMSVDHALNGGLRGRKPVMIGIDDLDDLRPHKKAADLIDEVRMVVNGGVVLVT